MSKSEPHNRSTHHDDHWLAWQYVLGELDTAGTTSFEDRLENESDLQFLLVDVVAQYEDLLAATSVADPTTATAVGSSRPVAKTWRQAPSLLAATTACLLIAGASYLLVANRWSTGVAQSVDESRDDLASLANAWNQTPDEFDDSSVDWTDEELAAHVADDDTEDSLDEAISWRVIALSGLEAAGEMN